MSVRGSTSVALAGQKPLADRPWSPCDRQLERCPFGDWDPAPSALGRLRAPSGHMGRRQPPASKDVLGRPLDPASSIPGEGSAVADIALPGVPPLQVEGPRGDAVVLGSGHAALSTQAACPGHERRCWREGCRHRRRDVDARMAVTFSGDGHSCAERWGRDRTGWGRSWRGGKLLRPGAGPSDLDPPGPRLRRRDDHELRRVAGRVAPCRVVGSVGARGAHPEADGTVAGNPLGHVDLVPRAG